jgi:hypothetical protein
MRNSRPWLALLAFSVLLAFTGRATAAAVPTLTLTGQGGSAFVLTARTSWRIDFPAAQVSGGRHYSGVALELLGRPADDGLTTLVTRMPTHVGGPPGELKALGAVNVNLPRGRYLLVLVGDGDVRVKLPISSGSVSRLTRTGSRIVGFREGVLRATPAGGLYTGHLGLALPAVADPIVTTKYVEVDAAKLQTNDETSCIRRGPGQCPRSSDPTFGTASQTTGGGRKTQVNFYDGYDGIGSGRSDLISSSDYRGTAQPASFYAAVMTVSGRNR